MYVGVGVNVCGCGCHPPLHTHTPHTAMVAVVFLCSGWYLLSHDWLVVSIQRHPQLVQGHTTIGKHWRPTEELGLLEHVVLLLGQRGVLHEWPVFLWNLGAAGLDDDTAACCGVWGGFVFLCHFELLHVAVGVQP